MIARPMNLIAELTYRCPLRCPYCSNPLDYNRIRDGLDTAGWSRVFREASDLGAVHVGLTGGEPSARRDLEELVAAAAEAGLYTHLVTAGLPLDPERLAELQRRGLRSVQLSIQDARAPDSDRIAGTPSFERKLELAHATRGAAQEDQGRDPPARPGRRTGLGHHEGHRDRAVPPIRVGRRSPARARGLPERPTG